MMSPDKESILKKIKAGYKSASSVPANLKLPRDIEFAISGSNVEIQLLGDSVGMNMQNDAGAFEGWALTLKRWAKYDKVDLSWDRKLYAINDPRYGHYQRFLFRVANFAADFRLWFSVSPKSLPNLTDLEIKPTGTYYLNKPSKSRNITKPRGKEGVLEFEYSFGKWADELKKESNADILDRQLPVGVFKTKVSISTAIFSRGKSAIDIWGISNTNELLIFELKAEKNNKMGIISELYFYCCVLKCVRGGQFKYDNGNSLNLETMMKTERIKGFFIAPALHPLIDKPLVDYINAGTSADMEFHYLKIPVSGGTPISLIF